MGRQYTENILSTLASVLVFLPWENLKTCMPLCSCLLSGACDFNVLSKEGNFRYCFGNHWNSNTS
jgi:hypothetical protein